MKGGYVFREFTEELLDLRLTEKGFEAALYASEEDGGGGDPCSSSCSSSGLCVSLCCTI